MKNYRISHLAKLCLLGGLFVYDALDWLGKTSFRVFVKCRRTRIDWLKRVSGYFEKNANFSAFSGGGGYVFFIGNTTGKRV